MQRHTFRTLYRSCLSRARYNARDKPTLDPWHERKAVLLKAKQTNSDVTQNPSNVPYNDCYLRLTSDPRTVHVSLSVAGRSQGFHNPSLGQKDTKASQILIINLLAKQNQSSSCLSYDIRCDECSYPSQAISGFQIVS